MGSDEYHRIVRHDGDVLAMFAFWGEVGKSGTPHARHPALT
jgi:hypothetical protein